MIPHSRFLRNVAGENPDEEEVDESQYVTKIVVEGTRTVEDESFTVETTTMTVLEKGKEHLAKIENTIHTISDKTKGRLVCAIII